MPAPVSTPPTSPVAPPDATPPTSPVAPPDAIPPPSPVAPPGCPAPPARAAPPASADLMGRCRFPPPPTTVSLAVSGGADSLALMVLAAEAGLDAVAIHVDHGLRPGSAAEADHVRAAADRLGVRFERRAVVVAPGGNLEERARRARYLALPEGVLTGHTADDQAETVLANLLRGAALDGLVGMRSTPRVQRPLLGLRRIETQGVCARAGLVPVDDPTNTDPRFLRNQIRHQLLPLLAEAARRDLVPVLSRQAALLADDAALLDELAAGVDPTDTRALLAAPLPLARRALRTWLRAGPGADADVHPPSAAEIERVLAVAAGAAVGCQLAGGRWVRRRGGRLRIVAG